ncbi:MAG: hypothetical protein ACK56I_30940, partial [bacterium]
MPSGTSATRAAVRSAKKTCRSAFDSADCTRSMKIARSLARPWSKGSVPAPSIASTQRSGAVSPRAALATCWRAAVKNSATVSPAGRATGRSRSRGSGRTALTSCANASTPSKLESGTTRDTSPV